MNFLFGIPYHKGRIDPSRYNKEKVIQNITQNYSKDPYRNHWGESNLHHSYNDNHNPEFIRIDYEQLCPLYGEQISNFLELFPTKKPWSYKWQIVNYTCTKGDQMMKAHNHHNSLFHAIHYLKFDSSHQPTSYINSHAFSLYFKNLYQEEKLDEIFDDTYEENSWMQEKYSLNTKEDDFLIVPSIIFHGIEASFSDSLRMTIVMNIYLDKY